MSSKIKIPKESFNSIKLQLLKCGINEPSLFQTMDALCNDINILLEALIEKVEVETDSNILGKILQGFEPAKVGTGTNSTIWLDAIMESRQDK